MSTVRALLTRAIRMTGARGIGDIPGEEEMEAVLEDAQALYLTFPIRDLADVLIADDYTAGENERITYASGAPVVTYPTTIDDCDGDRPPQNGALVEVTGASGSTRKIYIAELKTWMTLTGLGLNSEQPFGPTHDLDMAAIIAARVSKSVFAVEPSAALAELSRQGKANLRRAFRQAYAPTFDRALLTPADINVSL